MRIPNLIARALTGALIVTFALGSVVAAAEPEPYFQGFETDTTGWTGAIRVASGTAGIESRTGAWHAQTPPAAGAFTDWGGYSDTFPEGGYSTSIAVYLDVEQVAVNDTRFDFSSAINTTTPEPATTHRRDFVFNGGYYDDEDAGARFVFSASTNAGRANSFPKNPARDPFTITESGWYEFTHVFTDDGTGVLTVDLEIRDDEGTLLKTWTLSDPSDVIGVTVGGNRYGWFATQEFPVLAFDDSRLDLLAGPSTPATKDDCKNGGYEDLTDDDGQEFKNQGQCIKYSKGGGGNGGGE